jgi:hypothetical protein
MTDGQVTKICELPGRLTLLTSWTRYRLSHARMKSVWFLLLCLFAGVHTSFAQLQYSLVPDWLTPPPGKQTIGNSHGEIGVDSAGNIYVSVQEKDAGIQVYGADGKYLKTLPLPPSLHGFVIHKNDEGEFLYGAVLGEQRIIKARLDGTIVMEIPKTAFPEEQAAAGLKLTSCDVAPNGDIYVVDGYGKSWIFQFDKAGHFQKVFGGPGEPYNFKNTHKIFIDPRFSPVRILACDRGNNRILHLDLDGKILGVVADKGLRRPSSASFHGDLVCIAEIAGRISIWNKDNELVGELGVNDNPGQTNTPKVEPKDWQSGVVTSPHGITFDAQGNILETEWNQYGRVLRWNLR